MNTKKLLLGIILTMLGIIGIASTLTMEIPLPPEIEAILTDQFSPQQIKLLLLINPTLLLLIAVVLGTIFYQKANLSVPIIEKWVGIKADALDITDLVKHGVLGGVVAGVLLTLISLAFLPLLPAEFKELGDSLQPTLAARFLYGGITEELLMRFGLMTFIVWISIQMVSHTKPAVYWAGIIIAAILFAIGHFPVAYQAVEEPSTGLLAYLLLGNGVGGIIFGWLYWKKGLESAFIAHIFAHVVMVSAEPLLS
jgi:hypothetical protein